MNPKQTALEELEDFVVEVLVHVKSDARRAVITHQFRSQLLDVSSFFKISCKCPHK
ncbi:MAG: hypothetical protein OK457_09075 [Thaumarchaeota archaeon]|nr:hypothetical protein [Nitrososphaerota archaeon]